MAPESPRVIYIAAGLLLALLSTGSAAAAFTGAVPLNGFPAKEERAGFSVFLPALGAHSQAFRSRSSAGAAEAYLKARIYGERLYQAAA